MRVHLPVVSVFVLTAIFASAAPAGAAVLSALRVDPTPTGGARVVASFAGPPPQYRVVGSGSTELTVLLAQTQTGPNVPPMVQGAGPVVSVRYAVVGAAAQIVIRLAGPTPVRVTADARDIFVDVAPVQPLAVPGVPAFQAPPPSVVPPEVVEVVPLKYADLSEIVGILVEGQTIPPNDTFSPQPSQLGQTSGSFGGTFGNFGAPAQAPVQNFLAPGAQQSVGQRINEHVAIDRRLNAVVLSGSAQQVATLRAMIEKIDVALPSVILETQVVELTDSAAKSVGIDFTAGGGPIASVQYQIRSFNPPNASVNLQAAIYDVVSHGGGKLIARPRVVAQNGTSASILTGDAIPIITNITSFGSSTVTQQQVQYVSVGVNLQIQPRISYDGYVTSHIFSEVSSVTGYVQTFPQISQRVASTTATVRDGESFVLGGLIRESELRNLSRIPGIGSLPIIGGFFRNRQDTSATTNLYIVVTPHIVQRGGLAQPSAPAPAQAVPAPGLPVPTPAPSAPGPMPSPRP